MGGSSVGAEPGARDLVDEDRGLGLPASREVRLDPAAGCLGGRRVELARLAKPDHHDAGKGKPRGCDQLGELALPAFELAARKGPRERPARQPIELAGTRSELGSLEHAHHDSAFLGQLALVKANVHESLTKSRAHTAREAAPRQNHVARSSARS